MRAVLLGAVAVAAVICVPGADPAASDAVASHCQRSSAYPLDVCYAVGSKRTTRTHEFILFMGEPYFSRYRVCVRPWRSGETCRSFRARQMGVYSPRWGGNVSWERNYPSRGPGPYRVTWLHAGHRLGPPLTFYARLPPQADARREVLLEVPPLRAATRKGEAVRDIPGEENRRGRAVGQQGLLVPALPARTRQVSRDLVVGRQVHRPAARLHAAGRLRPTAIG
jgi:hypothetical protein